MAWDDDGADGYGHRVLLAVGDTISKIVDPKDRSTALLLVMPAL